MGFALLAPWALAGAALAAAAAIAAHFISWDRPLPSPLPTARFIPAPRAVLAARTRRLSDLLLLALRLLLVALIGIAFARPVLRPTVSGARRVVVSVGGETGRSSIVRDSTSRWLRSGDVHLVADSSVRRASLADTGSRWTGRTSVSAMLLGAIRVLDSLRVVPESSEIVVVAPFATRDVGAAAASIRGNWPGAVHLVRASPPRGDTVERFIDLRAGAGDRLRPALASSVVRAPGTRLVRDRLTAADSASARAGSTIVWWPGTADSLTPSASGLVTTNRAFVGQLARGDAGAGEAIARWHDGAVAATERAVGMGCIRTVGAGLPAGDIAIRPSFVAVVADLVQPCGRSGGGDPVSDSVLRRLERRPTSPSARAALARDVPLDQWAFLGALLIAVAELFARRRRSEVVT